MVKIEYHTDIKFLHLKINLTKSKTSLIHCTYDDASSSVKNRVSEYKLGYKSIIDDARSGRPKTAIIEEIRRSLLNPPRDPRLLTVDYNCVRLEIARECLIQLNSCDVL